MPVLGPGCRAAGMCGPVDMMGNAYAGSVAFGFGLAGLLAASGALPASWGPGVLVPQCCYKLTWLASWALHAGPAALRDAFALSILAVFLFFALGDLVALASAAASGRPKRD